MRTCCTFLLASMLLVVSSISGSAVSPNCDGTSKKNIKCPGGIPLGYFESATCAGDLPGLGMCENAIAFNHDDFGCTAPALDNSETPPAYTTYCADAASATSECSHSRICVAENRVKPDGVTQYTNCSQSGSVVVISRLLKITRSSSSNNVNTDCVKTVPLPGQNPPPKGP